MHEAIQELVVLYVEKVAFAFAVGAAEASYRLASCADFFGCGAFLGFAGLFDEYAQHSRFRVVEEVVDVPEFVFGFLEVAFYSFFQVVLGGAYVSVYAFVEGYCA